MATRNFPQSPMSNVLKAVSLNVAIVGAGTGNAPVLGSGDPKASFFAQPVRSSTGVFTLTTLDPYPGICGLNLEYCVASPSTSSVCVVAPSPVQNANNTWTFTINAYTGGTLTDPVVGSTLFFTAYMQNTGDPYAG